jgi:hypothetical protein
MVALSVVALVNPYSISPEQNTVKFTLQSLQIQEEIGCNGERMAVASDESFVLWASPNIGKRVVVGSLFQFEHFESDSNGGLSTIRMELNETNALTGRKRLVHMHFEMEKVQWPLA